MLRLRDPHGPGLVERTIRTHDAYLVPRADGRYVLGATMEERGFDTAPTAGGVFELLRDISEVVPGVLELELEEVLAGLRPATPDNLPAIGAHDGLVWATGHYRNGILLSRADRRAGRRGAVRRAAAGLGGGGRSRPLRGGARMTILLNGEARELATGTTVRALLGRARRPRRRARRRGRGRRRGGAARRVGDDRARRGCAGRGPARDPGRLKA